MIYIANFAFVIFEPDTPATPVAWDGTPPIQDIMGCVHIETVTDMLLSAKNMSLKTERNIGSTDYP